MCLFEHVHHQRCAYSQAAPVPLTIGDRFGPYRSCARWAPAAWARCSGRTTRAQARRRAEDPAGTFARTPTASRGSSGKPKCSPRSTIRTLPRFTVWSERTASGAGHGTGRGADARRAHRAGCRSRSMRRCPSPGRLPKRSKPRTRKASSIATSSRPTSRSRPDGTVKVLDFGLAKALDRTGDQDATRIADHHVARRRRDGRDARARPPT